LREHHAEEDIQARHFHTDWNLTDGNIEVELDRGDQSNVSFYFALRWLTFEISQLSGKANN